MDDIAEAAGVSSATAYNHFPSKQTLIGQVYAAQMQPVLHQLERDQAVGRPAPAALGDHLCGLAHVARRRRSLTAAFACAVQEHTARVQRRADPDNLEDPRTLVPIPLALATLISAGQRTGEFGHNRDPTDLAEQLTFLLFLRRFTHPDETAEDTAAMLQRIAFGVLCPERLQSA
jgi:AcrR family transcriptional regulator